MDRLLGLVGFVFVVSITPGPNNALLWASGLRFGFRRASRHVAGTAVGMAALVLATAATGRSPRGRSGCCTPRPSSSPTPRRGCSA